MLLVVGVVADWGLFGLVGVETAGVVGSALIKGVEVAAVIGGRVVIGVSVVFVFV